LIFANIIVTVFSAVNLQFLRFKKIRIMVSKSHKAIHRGNKAIQKNKIKQTMQESLNIVVFLMMMRLA